MVEYSTVVAKYEQLLRSKEYCKWTRDDFKLAIKRKQGIEGPPDGEPTASSMKKADIKAFYEANYINKTIVLITVSRFPMPMDFS